MQIVAVMREWAILIGRVLARRWLDRRDIDPRSMADRDRTESRMLQKNDDSAPLEQPASK
jgi:hypothetical protein